jgi:hypothetical protein
LYLSPQIYKKIPDIINTKPLLEGVLRALCANSRVKLVYTDNPPELCWMKKKIAGWMLAGLLSGAPAMAAHQADTLDVLFWNLENFFDYRDQGTSESDAEFSGRGLRHWTKKRFLTKCNAVAKTLLWTAGQTGRMPDVVAVAEVENRFVLKQLLRETALRKQPWGIAHYESPDHRGIDVGLLWRTDRWDTVCTRACHVFGPDGAVLPTRDILLVQLQRRAGAAPAVDRWAILVNHHPSKYGGASSAWRREAAVDRLRELCDSLRAAGWSRIVATGDFNDTADAPLFQRLDALENLALPLAARGQGTIRFNGRWELIDLFFLSNVPAPASSGLASPGSAARMTILHPPFLTERDKTHSGEKPRRTYIGPRYNGGVSDHRPIHLRLCYPSLALDQVQQGGVSFCGQGYGIYD